MSGGNVAATRRIDMVGCCLYLLRRRFVRTDLYTPIRLYRVGRYYMTSGVSRGGSGGSRGGGRAVVVGGGVVTEYRGCDRRGTDLCGYRRITDRCRTRNDNH